MTLRERPADDHVRGDSDFPQFVAFVELPPRQNRNLHHLEVAGAYDPNSRHRPFGRRRSGFPLDLKRGLEAAGTHRDALNDSSVPHLRHRLDGFDHLP